MESEDGTAVMLWDGKGQGVEGWLVGLKAGSRERWLACGGVVAQGGMASRNKTWKTSDCV